MDLFDMFDKTCPDELPLGDSPLDPRRVMDLVRAGAAKTARPRPKRRAVWGALIAAALTACLTVTAYAVYEIFIDRYTIDQETPFLQEDMKTFLADQSRISMVGAQGTPEYKAFTEWENWQWEHPGDWTEPESGLEERYLIYGAGTREEADVLDEIAARHGLTLHTSQAFINRTATLYDLLGTEPFYSDALAGNSSGYVYDDGAFKDEGKRMVFADGRAVDLTTFVSAKGSFSTFSRYVGLGQSYEEWSYTTKSGVTVDLVLAANNAEILAETDGAYISISADAGSAPNYDPETDPWLSDEQKERYLESFLQIRPDMTEEEQEHEWELFRQAHIQQWEADLPPAITREELETIADCVDFSILEDRFDGAPHPEAAEKVAALDAQLREEASEPYVPSEADSQTVLDELGGYTIGAVPENYMDSIGGFLGFSSNFMAEWDVYDEVDRVWWDSSYTSEIALEYRRYFADESRTASVTEEAFRDARAYYVGTDYPATELNGCEGFVFSDGPATRALWYDEARDLLFEIYAFDPEATAEEMAELAGTVTEDPDAAPHDPQYIPIDPDLPPTPPPA